MEETAMEEILQLIISNLVENKESVEILKEEKENLVVLKIKVDKSDIGRVIGKHGNLIKSIRTVIKSISTKERKKVVVDIIEE